MLFSLDRRRMLLGVAATLCLPGVRALAQASGWPGRNIRFVTQSAPGDAVDVRLRELLLDLGPLLNGQTLIPDNKPGAGGVLAHQSVLNAPADGYSVLLANATMTILPAFNRKLSYNPLEEFTPVAVQGLSPIGLAIPASRPEKTLDDWLQWARQQGDQLNYGSVGNGSVSHLYGFQLADDMGFRATHIPFKGGTPGLLAMLAGDVHYGMYDTFSLRPLLNKGGLRVLAVTGEKRSRFLPNVPTFKELGHAGYDRMGWTGYFLKKETPVEIVARLAQSINQVNAKPQWSTKREQLWSEWHDMTPEQLATRVQTDAQAWASIVQKTGVYAD
ncbi:hypothetical protein CAP48_08890 [Advenella sp. S44]|uniref:Bug family tripartite tricarboxylate transporter substrate binding protein n=1 Tax=Advenella sp. S44 TaxID=1982755 RepID=UPI000C2B3552|nr:tripartite tricarboxylate transporter substrate binding protein [Advenella sp. S44]PJX26115.1 hypothetical protein CAP48_08890 [Advenella sp. S44]